MNGKRLFALLLAVVLIVSLIPHNILNAAEPKVTVITVEDSTAMAGSTVRVNITITDNPGILAMTLKLNFDESVANIISVENGEAMSAMSFAPPTGDALKSGCLLSWDAETISAEDVKDGTIATLTFKVADNAQSNLSAVISVSQVGNVVDDNMQPISVTTVAGNMQILDYIPGDVNGDGQVSSTDTAYLRRYIAGGYNVTINEDAGDVNADRLLTAVDVALIRRFIAGGYGVVLKPAPTTCAHLSVAEVAAVEPACTEDGNIAYWYCVNCKKYFTDAEATTEIAYVDTVISATGHTEVIDEAKASTYTETGLTEGSHCSVCGEVFVAQEEIPMLTANYHSITYKNLNGAESPEITQYAEHNGLIDMPEPSLDGYKFVGWYTQSVGGAIIDYIPVGSTKDYVLFAHWELETYTITYKDAPVNSNVPTYTVEDRIVLSDPQWSGLKFVEWTDEKGQPCSQIDRGTIGDIELTANWQQLENMAVPADGVRELWTDYDEKNGHQIFIYELGKIHHVVLEELDSKYKYYGGSLQWQEEKTVSLDESVSQEVSTAVSNSVTKTSEHTITNDWTKNHSETYERGFHVGVEWSPIKDILKIEAGGEFNWTDTDESSWSESTTNSDGVEESIENTTSNSSTVAYNQTVSKSFTTSATIGENMPEGEYRYVYYGTVRVFAVVTYEPSSGNYRLDTVSVLDEGIGSMPLYTPPANTTANIQVSDGLPCVFPLEELEAFIENSYYVTYDSDGGIGSMYDGYYPTNQKHTLSENQFVKTGYTWTGWKVDGIDKIVQKDELVSNLANNGQRITAVAQWAKNTYTIAYNGNKPVNASSSVLNIPNNTACIYDEDVILGKAPTLTGWTFGGWFKDAACTVKAGNEEETLSTPNFAAVAGSTITLYAKWTAKTCVVTYDANGGFVDLSSESKIYDNAYGALPTPKRDNFTFVGWHNGSTQVSASTVVKTASDHTLTAHWTPNTTGYWHSGSRERTISTSGWTEYWDAGLDREALKAQGYTKVQIELSIDGYFKSGDWFKADWYFDVYDRWDGKIHQEKHSNFNRSWENRKYTFTISIDAIRDDGTIRIRYDHEGDGQDDWALGTVIINTTAK